MWALQEHPEDLDSSPGPELKSGMASDMLLPSLRVSFLIYRRAMTSSWCDKHKFYS